VPPVKPARAARKDISTSERKRVMCLTVRPEAYHSSTRPMPQRMRRALACVLEQKWRSNGICTEPWRYWPRCAHKVLKSPPGAQDFQMRLSLRRCLLVYDSPAGSNGITPIRICSRNSALPKQTIVTLLLR
jgi:hypothetical protein